MWRPHLSKVGAPILSFYLCRSSSGMYCSSSDFFPSLFKHRVFKYVEVEWFVSVRCRFSTNIAPLMIVVFVKFIFVHLWMCGYNQLLSISSFFTSKQSNHSPTDHSFIYFLNIHLILEQTLIHSFISWANTDSFIHFLNKHWFIHSFINKQHTPSILQLRQQNRLQFSGISSKAADSVAQQIGSHRILYASHRLSFSTIQHPAERALIHLEVVLVRRAVLRRQRLKRQLALTSPPNPLLPPANRWAPAATWGRSWAYRNQPRPRFPPQNGTKHPSPPS